MAKKANVLNWVVLQDAATGKYVALEDPLDGKGYMQWLERGFFIRGFVAQERAADAINYIQALDGGDNL